MPRLPNVDRLWRRDGQSWEEAHTGVDGAAGETAFSVDRKGEVRLIRVRRD